MNKGFRGFPFAGIGENNQRGGLNVKSLAKPQNLSRAQNNSLFYLARRRYEHL